MTAEASKKLLIRPRPRSGESFTGYIIRLTELNQYDSPSWIFRRAGIGYHRQKCAATSHTPIDLSALASLSNVDKSDLESLRYPTDRRSNSSYRRLFYGLTVPQYVIRQRHPKVCPKCLREAVYIRRIWEFALVTVCPIHSCLLIDECPNCGKRISWLRNSVAACPCKYDWREFIPPTIENSESNITRQIHLLCRLTVEGANTQSNDSFETNLLYRVDLQYLVAALLFIASQFTRADYKRGRRLIDTTGKNFARTRRNVEIHDLLCRAVSVFNDWPNNYFQFLEWRRSHIPNLRFTSGIDRDFHEYKSALYYQLAARQLDFMRAAFEEYLATRWEGGYAAYLRRLSPALLVRSKYVSRNDAKEFLHIKAEGVDKLIALGKLNAVIRYKGSARTILIERTSLEYVKHEFGQLIYLKQVAAILGLPKQRICELIKCNLLRSANGEYIDGRSSVAFSSEEVRSLLSAVNGQLMKGRRVAPNENVEFLKALRILGRKSVDVGQFIQLILDGTICPIGKGPKPGLASLTFSKSDINCYITELERSWLGETYSAAEVAKILGIGLSSTRFLISKGLIQSRRQAVKGHHDLRISKSAVDIFNSTYTLPAKLVHQFNTTSSRLTNLLMVNGVNPVSGPKTDEGKQYVFNRVDVENINLKALWSASESEHISRLNERNLIEAEHAAEILSIKQSEVLDLATRGILLPHRHVSPNRHKTDGPFFSMFILEKYKAQMTDYSGLVSATAAAEMLSVSVATLYRYIPKGLLHVALDRAEAGRCYFYLREVKTLIEEREKLRRQCITTTEVAHICKVAKESVHEWVAAGLLHPISGPRASGLIHRLYLRSDVEKLRVEREAFKAKRVSEGRSSRFGRSSRANRRSVRNEVAPRIKQLVKKWNAKPDEQRISGEALHRQLITEGYKIGINTVYVCLRELRQQTSLN